MLSGGGDAKPLEVISASTGKVVSVDSIVCSNVAVLKQFLKRHTGINEADQILLRDGMKLSATNLDLRNADKDAPLILYDQKLLLPNAKIPTIEPLLCTEVDIPPITPFVPPANAPPIVSTYARHLNNFSKHSILASVVASAVEERVTLCRNSIEDRQRQALALKAAIVNLNKHYAHIVRGLLAFKAHLYKLQPEHQNLLDNAERHIAKLKETTLHPALQTNDQKTLIDRVSESRLRRWLRECITEHDRLMSRLSSLEQTMMTIERKVQIEKNTSPDSNIEALQELVQKVALLSDKQRSTAQEMGQDERRVRSLYETSLTPGKDQSAVDQEADVVRTHERHITLLDEISQAEKASAELVRGCSDALVKMHKLVHKRLQNVAALETTIRDCANTIIVFREVLSRKKDAFDQLAFLEHLPEAYEAALVEVARRRSFGVRMNAMLLNIASQLETFWRDEQRRRDKFLDMHGRFVPKTLIPGLVDNLPQINKCVTTAAFDHRLPHIDADPQAQKGKADPDDEPRMHISLPSEIEATDPADDDINSISEIEQNYFNLQSNYQKLNADNINLKARLSKMVERNKMLITTLREERGSSAFPIDPKEKTTSPDAYRKLRIHANRLEGEVVRKTKKIDELKGYVSALSLRLQFAENEHSELRKESEEPNTVRIAFSGFVAGNYGMFLWDAKHQAYEAYNIGCPNYYLSPESYQAFEFETKLHKPVLGQIIEIVKAPNSTRQDPNWLVTIAPTSF